MQGRNVVEQLVWGFRSLFVYRNFWWYFQVANHPVTVRFWQGGELYVRDRVDAVVVNEVFLGRVYDEVFRGASSVFDGGANIGAASLRAKQLGASRIVSVEACKNNYIVLSRNVNSFALTHHAALCGREGYVELWLSDNHGNHSIIDKKSDDFESVRCMMVPNGFDVIKLDLEGAEGIVLRTMDFNGVLTIICETPELWVDEFLENKGFFVRRNELIVTAHKVVD
jgi:FkbM family methyltransferase